MSRKDELVTEYAEKLKEYEEKLNFSTNFSVGETLSLEEHKMLVEGYQHSDFHKSSLYEELEKADLSDFLFWERRHGGTNL